ncbi:MAG TPA: YicC/YloC family endoribonuclease [Bryobacteraceae bacterium]|nr:YicC/YloC family endoribonuclease [Bryobacteraceae bacterium]
MTQPTHRPVRSMTGYARVQHSSEWGEISVAIRSLNHRGLDPHFHLPPAFDAFENAMRAAIKENVARGHLDLRIIWTPAVGGSGGLNQTLFQSWLDAFREAAQELGISGATPDLNSALRVPGMVAGESDQPLAEAAETEVISLLRRALSDLNAFREREGEQLANVIAAHNSAIQERAAELERIRGSAVPLLQNRLNERLAELLRGATVEPQRLAQEAAILADRSDISEEIARLKIHAGQVAELVTGGGEVGKKLDFLLQEMNRETNTILSKTSGIGELGLRVSDLALAAKADIEKIREQALNLE